MVAIMDGGIESTRATLEKQALARCDGDGMSLLGRPSVRRPAERNVPVAKGVNKMLRGHGRKWHQEPARLDRRRAWGLLRAARGRADGTQSGQPPACLRGERSGSSRSCPTRWYGSAAARRSPTAGFAAACNSPRT